MGRFTEITSSVTKQYRDAGQWGNYRSLVESSTLCALRFHNPDQPFYLYYKGYTKNVGWDTPVKSTDYSYAGSLTGRLQAVGISLYNSSTGQLWDNTYVMMYRAYCENYWLPWVSNATPNLMRQVQDEFNLGGTLNYSGTNTGLPGGDGAMTKFEIRIFKDNGSDAPSGGGLASGISQRYMVNSSWNTLTSSTSVSAFHGVELKTSGKPYYLYYRTYNTGHGWYPFVRSTEADYAGSPGKAIEGIQIQVYDNSGQRINERHVVMYRAYAGGRWLSWVSNAPLSIMQMLQNRYSLGGSLDSRSYYAGLLDKGAPITKLDIRVYEYVSNSDAPGVGGLDGITQIYHANGEWHTLTPDTYVSQMDHVKFSTYGKDYYLYYQAYSAGHGWYPRVSSDGTDDAGSTGKAIEGLAIDVYSKSGEKLRDRVAVMYRAYANGRWLPWVSNADPDIMQRIHSAYHLGGTLDTAGAYAGIKGGAINRLEVRVYTGVGSLNPLPGAGGITMSCAHQSGSWQSFSESYMGTVSGIKIQTPGKPYYLQYRTWNEGRTDYYPWVTSNINDYAGSFGKPVQRLQIQAYKNNGAKLTSGIVVMYRTYTNGRWLPWVSNADPSSMRYVQSKYALPGALETTASYAGIPGANIGGVEIRVYEESLPSGDGQPDIPDFPDIPANGRGMKIYIDAGHGGSSPGTTWGNNLEKNYNLEISRLQEKYFKQKGFQVKMARTTDVFSTLAERSGEANAWGAHLYLSNHINAGGGKGVTTFYQAKSAESKKYATAIEQELKKVVGTSMGVRTRVEDGEDYYHVLRETRMTSVLIEHCFLDNAEDRALLNTPGALDAMAKATVNAVCSCIPDYTPPVINPDDPFQDPNKNTYPRFVQLYNLAYQHVSDNHPGMVNREKMVLANSFMAEYLRKPVYSGIAWNGAAGNYDKDGVFENKADQLFVLQGLSFTEKITKKGNLFDLTDRKTGTRLGIFHLMAVVSSILFNQRNKGFRDATGWLGDIYSILMDLTAQPTFDIYSESKRLIASESGPSSFSLEDYIQDVDAVNITRNIANSNYMVSLAEALIDYHGYFGYFKRTEQFLRNEFGNSLNILEDTTNRYFNSYDPEAVLIRGVLNMIVGAHHSYSSQNASSVAKAFRDVVSEKLISL